MSECLVKVADGGFGHLSLVEDDAVRVGSRLPCFELHGPAVLREGFVHRTVRKRVGGKESVIAGVPAVWMSRGGRMLHEGDGMGSTVDRPGVVDPIGTLAPAVGVLVASAIEHVAFSLRFVGAFDAHGFGDADSGCTFLGVAERHRLLRREFDGEIDGARGWGHGVEAKGLFGDKMHFSILLSDPFL